MEKKGNGKFIVIIILLIIVCLGLGGYIVYDKVFVKDTNNTSESIKSDSTNVINFDKNNCINNSKIFNDINGNISVRAYSNGVDLYTTEDNHKQLYVSARYDIMYPDKYTQEDILKNNSDYLVEPILDFDKNIESIYVGQLGSDYTSNVFLFLLDDGTVEYMRYNDIYENRKFEHYTVDGIKDIVRFENIAYHTNSSDTGANTVIAYKNDGTYYDLSLIIK